MINFFKKCRTRSLDINQKIDYLIDQAENSRKKEALLLFNEAYSLSDSTERTNEIANRAIEILNEINRNQQILSQGENILEEHIRSCID